jgi:hypothetical protein
MWAVLRRLARRPFVREVAIMLLVAVVAELKQKRKR